MPDDSVVHLWDYVRNNMVIAPLPSHTNIVFHYKQQCKRLRMTLCIFAFTLYNFMSFVYVSQVLKEVRHFVVDVKYFKAS